MENGKFTASKKNDELENLLYEACRQQGLELSPKQASDLMTYRDMLLETNQYLNLTAITEPREVVLKHFVDSLSPVKLLPEGNFTAIDIGTGAGFPSLPIKIVTESMNLTMLDSVNKKLNFIEDVISRLNLENAKTLHARAEDAAKAKEHRENYGVCFTRAVARLNVLAEYCLPFLQLGGRLIAMKGPDVTEELNEAKPAVKILGGEISQVLTYTIPFTDITHTLISIDKIHQTPSKYPRKPGIVSKNPIKA